MRILPNTFAVFWKPSASCRVQFMADVPAASAEEAFSAFRSSFPSDLVCSVRDHAGRFAAYLKA